MSKMFIPDISPSNVSLPYHISLFSETLQVVFSLLSQILGLEDDKSITEIMVGTVCLVIQSTKEFLLAAFRVDSGVLLLHNNKHLNH